jgi:hypothetical protein
MRDRIAVHRNRGLVWAASIALAFGCTAAVPGASPTEPPLTPGATATPAAATPPSTPALEPPTAAPATPAETLPVSATPDASATTFRVVLDDGPRAGTWEVSAPAGAVPVCSYLPDLERWLATWYGPPPLSFVDVRGEEGDAWFLVKFSDEPNELDITPAGEVIFEVDDRGDSATLTWVSEANEGTYFDSQGNNMGEEEMGRAELTVECGSVYRYS